MLAVAARFGDSNPTSLAAVAAPWVTLGVALGPDTGQTPDGQTDKGHCRTGAVAWTLACNGTGLRRYRGVTTT